MICWSIDFEADSFLLSIATGGSLKHEWEGGVLPARSFHSFFFFPLSPVVLSLILSFPSFAGLMNIERAVPAMRLAAATAEGLYH